MLNSECFIFAIRKRGLENENINRPVSERHAFCANVE